MLTLQNSGYEDGHHFVRWRPVSQGMLRAAQLSLGKQLKSYLSLRCTHLKGRGGAKTTVRFAQTMASQYRYVARFDIRSYYESMDHTVLLKLLEETGIDTESYALVSDYLSLPDMKLTGCEWFVEPDRCGDVSSHVYLPKMSGRISLASFCIATVRDI